MPSASERLRGLAETKLLHLFLVLADLFLLFCVRVGRLITESLAADAVGSVVLSLARVLVVPTAVPSLIRLHTGSALLVLLVFNLVNVRKSVLISAQCRAGPVETLGGDKGQEVAECL